MPTKIEELKKRQEAAKSREERANRTARKAREEYFELKREIHREELKAGIGNEVHVTRGLTPQATWLNEAVGTLLKVNRKYCVIDFGENGKWNIPVRDVFFVAEDPGQTLGYLASGCGKL